MCRRFEPAPDHLRSYRDRNPFSPQLVIQLRASFLVLPLIKIREIQSLERLRGPDTLWSGRHF